MIPLKIIDDLPDQFLGPTRVLLNALGCDVIMLVVQELVNFPLFGLVAVQHSFVANAWLSGEDLQQDAARVVCSHRCEAGSVVYLVYDFF